MEQHKILTLTPPCTTSRARPSWVSISSGSPSNRNQCHCLPAVHCPPPNNWRVPPATAWRTWDIVLPPSLIWLAPMGQGAWTTPSPLVASVQCRLSSVPNVHHRTPLLENLPAAPTLHLPAIPIYCHLHWEGMVAFIPILKPTTEHVACRYNVQIAAVVWEFWAYFFKIRDCLACCRYIRRTAIRQQIALIHQTKEVFREFFQTQTNVAMVAQLSLTTQTCIQRWGEWVFLQLLQCQRCVCPLDRPMLMYHCFFFLFFFSISLCSVTFHEFHCHLNFGLLTLSYKNDPTPNPSSKCLTCED